MFCYFVTLLLLFYGPLQGAIKITTSIWLEFSVAPFFFFCGEPLKQIKRFNDSIFMKQASGTGSSLLSGQMKNMSACTCSTYNMELLHNLTKGSKGEKGPRGRRGAIGPPGIVTSFPVKIIIVNLLYNFADITQNLHILP